MKIKVKNIKEVFEIIFQIFSFNLISEFTFRNILFFLFDDLKKKKFTTREQIEFSTTVEIENIKFLNSMFFFLTFQSNKNKGKKIFPKKNISEEDFLKIASYVIIEIYESLGEKYTFKTQPPKGKHSIRNITENLKKKIKISVISKILNENHYPPLTSIEAYKNQKIKSKKNKNGFDIYLYKDNDIISKLPLNYFKIGYTLKELRSLEDITVPIRFYIQKKYHEKLKKRFSGKDENFSNSLFSLLSYYNVINYYVSDEDENFIFDWEIKEKKIIEDIKNSDLLLSTPISAPVNKSFYSLFPYVEKEFGSLGSFHDAKLENEKTYTLELYPNLYVCEKISEFIYKKLEKQKLTFIIIIYSLTALNLEEIDPSVHFEKNLMRKDKSNKNYIYIISNM